MKIIQEIEIMASDFLSTIEPIIASIKAAHPGVGINEAQVKSILQEGLQPVQAEADQTKADLLAANQRIADLEQGTTDLAKAEAGADATNSTANTSGDSAGTTSGAS